ncbi:isopeptide-forming domain-containing fimbrial protein [Microbulbifer donghaiensis]|uniref:isopeptide-forming domain-containing fimbrial protein n=1 Tax=Microbulbifer donghaiensis TaxID=494016 RepID=UPI0013566739|nr:isopeptide-forming domain-containing fimbrial protein [Microbulbifer donghaiensis]
MSLPFSQMVLAANFATSDFSSVPTVPGDPGLPQDCVIDGPGSIANDGRAFAGSEQLSIDRSCTVKNFSCASPLSSTLNFASVEEGTLIIFDNVCYTGNFACANVDGGKAYVWAVNGSDFSSVKEGCQDLIIPVEKIDKRATDLTGTPISSVTVGVPFIYTLDVPVMYDPVSGTVLPGVGSPNEIQSITIWDDLSSGTLGVDLIVRAVRARYGSTPMVEGVDYDRSYEGGGSDNNPGKIALEIINPNILAAGEQVHFEFEVELKDTANNFIGKSFINTAEWEFARKIGDDFYDPLPGENGVAELLSISAPDLVMTKGTSASAINFADMPTFTLNVQNVGGSPAWNILIEDELPVGMQEFDPTTDTITVTMAGAALTEGTDFTVSYNSGPGLLTIELLDAAGGLAPNQQLQITYRSQMDQPGRPNEPANGEVLTNVAAATTWYNDASTNSSRIDFSGQLTDGTVGTDDEQDAVSVTAALSGYYFEKTVSNVTTGQAPTTTAFPGDRLRYTLRLFNLDQDIYNVQITDQLDLSRFDLASVVIDQGTCPTGASCSIDGAGLITISSPTGDLDVIPGSSLASIEVAFEVDTLAGLVTGDTVSNQAQMDAEDADTGGVSFSASSDDPNVNGVYNQADPPAAALPDATVINIVSIGPLLKQNPADTEVAIGEEFSYTITVPATAVPAPLYDVQVHDSLPSELEFVAATAAVGATNYTLSNTGTGTDLLLQDTVTGLDIPAGAQALVTLRVRVKNDLANQDGVTFSNTASYSYSRTQGGSQNMGSGNSTAAMTIVEPNLTAAKSVTNISRGGTAAARGGDTLEYTVALTNNGSSVAYDLAMVDTLPTGVTLESGSATIDGAPAAPDINGNLLTWGRANGDALDIPVGGTLTLVYRVLVNTVDGSDLVNSVTADWTSLDGPVTQERTGGDAPDAAALNNYFITVASQPLATEDNTAFAKTVAADSWDDTFSTAVDRKLRVGDSVTYQLTLTLREGLTESVQVVDTLPAGLQLVSAALTHGSNVSVTPIAQPAAGDTGALTWDLGDITNTPDADDTNDQLVIEYVAEVITDTLAHTAITNLPNSAQLTYTGAAAPIPASVSIDVLQPLLTAIDKTGTVTDGANPVAVSGDGSQATPYLVDLASHQMDFALQSCNNGDAPAYNVAVTDTLASQLDEADLATAPAVAINGAAVAVSDFDYTAPTRGGSFQIVLHDDVPLPPGQCLTVTYSIGFHTDVTTTAAWSNGAALDNYWSLPATAGQEYTDGTADHVWMINGSNPLPPVKALLSPGSEVTIGETVTYSITVPADNIVRNNLVISDTLPAALIYDSAAVAAGGNPATVTDNSSGQDISLVLASVPAGQEVVVTLTTHVANSVDTNAGDTFSNSASYIYDGGTALASAPSAELLIVEPQVTVDKIVDPDTTAQVGDILTYTVTLEAQDGANFSTAFDLLLVDTLSTGLQYLAGTATVDGAASEPTVTGSPQVLSWPAWDLVKGQQVVVEYQVQVQDDVAPGQILSNVATATWTSLSGADSNERDGSGGFNDYRASDSTNVGAPDNTTLAKAWLTDTFGAGDDNLRVGDRVDFTLTLGLQKGTHSDLELVDSLPLGMVFERVVSVSEFGVAGTADPLVSGDGISAPQTLSWNWASLTNPVGSSSDELRIVYRARVLNDVLAQNPTSRQLLNSATLDYTVAGVAAPTKTAEATVELLQPELSVAKSATTADGDDVIVAGEIATYTVAVTNGGAAPAYDLVVSDTLPVGMRQNGGPSTVSINGISSTLVPSYDANTGIARWNLDSGSADTYTIQPGETLTLVYEVSADTDLGAGLTLTNSAQAELYYSFDNNDVPSEGVVGERQEYGPSAPATAALTTPGPGVLSKVATQTTVAIGEQLTYTITVPATPVNVALQDVQIHDNLAATGVDLSFVAATLGGVALTNSGSANNLVLFDTSGGIDIPAGGQVEVQITVEVLNSANNQARTTPFVNRAWYDYDNGVARQGDDASTGGDANPVTIVHPELVVDKTGPASLHVGTPDNFTLDVLNSGDSSAWNVTLTDWLPNPTPGGICDVQPAIQTAVIYKADNSTVTLSAADFAVNFVAGDPTCEFSATLQTDDALAPGDRLSLSYQVEADGDNINGSTLVNIAGATQWFSADASSSERFAYQRQLTDGTPGVVDHQDSHEFSVESVILETRKTVLNLTTGQAGTEASPGDRLQYTIEIQNTSDVPLSDFTLVDELDRLNASAMFAPNSIGNAQASSGVINVTANGGTKGTGLLEVSNLTIAEAGQPGDTLTIVFEVTLASVINSGTVVLNQAQLTISDVVFGLSDDPLVGGAEDPTATLISSTPLFRVEKTSEDITDDADLLLAGDTLRYTIRVENTGSENAVDMVLRDLVPANTTYIANSTTLNGAAVADVGGTTALSADMAINSPGEAAGVIAAAASGAEPAVITFDVTINDVGDGTLISNQGFVNGGGTGSGAFEEVASDDPTTEIVNDPTVDIVGDVPLLLVQKTVEISEDNLSVGIVDPGDVLRYTITVTNAGGVDATDAVLTDQMPANTTYEAGTTKLNGFDVADNGGGTSRLDAGLPIASDDLTPPLPGAGEGAITSGQTATVTFEVRVNAGTPTGTVISNQGSVTTVELPLTLTDADGNPSNGAQPTQVVVGDAQQLSITKEVAVVGGAAAEPGAVLEYLVKVTNISGVPATYVTITDDLLVAGDGVLTYVGGSAQLNGQAAGITMTGSVITADFAGTFGELQPDATATLRFQARLADNLAIGYRVLNTAQVQWNDPASMAQASVAIDLGGTPGIANLAGYLWHDVNFDGVLDGEERLLQNWSVALYFNNALQDTVQSDENGFFQFSGLVPNYASSTTAGGASYELRYSAPNAGASTASLGNGSSDFTNGPQKISDIYVGSGSNLQNLNLPLTPNGVIYDSVLRVPVSGATVTMLSVSSGMALPDSCFDDPKQQGQVTQPGGHYKFDINFSGAACAANSDYLIQVQMPGDAYIAGESQIIPPQTNGDTAAFDVAACLGSSADAVPGTADYCEAQLSELPQPVDVDAQSDATNYYLRLRLDDNRIPGESQLFNNHIAVDPQLDGALSITKTAAMLNVTRSQLVPYTITFSNTLPVPLTDLRLVDFFPAGFKYVAGSAQLDGMAVEPQTEGLQLIWSNLRVDPDQTRTVKLLLVVGSGVGEDEYINRARMFNDLSGQVASGEASATVRVIPDPTFDCTDVIGKVYDDKNMNGYQDAGEGGVPGARVVTATGLNATTDAHGRFHITCAVVPNQDRGSNFVLKLDDRSLPSGYRLTSENPRVVRATRGKMIKVNFGSSLHRVVRLDMAEAVFEPGTTELRPQWHSRTELLLEKLSEAPSVLRLAYLAENEEPGLVDERLDHIKAQIAEQWAEQYGDYELTIETEIFWRRGAPPSKEGLQ